MRRTILAALAAVPLLALWPPAPAAAHGGPVVLDVAGDGATGVTVRATYKDGHPVEDRVLRLVLNATGEGGLTVGPLQLNPAGEGQGFYASGAVLTPGRWTVAVTSPEPNPGKAQATVQAHAPQSAPPRPAAAPRPDEDGGGTGRWWLVGGALLLVAAAALALTARRAKASPGRPG
ncbi:hypothetical protein [Micromonospora sp. KC723]|uniref:hypothetical protein n=1 Tax=Micromonospora sp. KC723 TaxID=2530381 RepID=UPI001FB7C017|nr:hypothetical protein [Micromonospora sp. KC723]